MYVFIFEPNADKDNIIGCMNRLYHLCTIEDTIIFLKSEGDISDSLF